MYTRWLRPRELAGLGGWDLWRLREVGSWGDSGRVLGARWEALGGELVRGKYGVALVPLWTDRTLGRWLGTLGLPNPDAILVESGGDGVATLRPVDLKWSIDTAEYSQIAGETLRGLIERAGSRLTAMLPSTDRGWRYGDGLFATPDRPLNRLFLASRANAKRPFPIEAREIRWLSLEANTFFEPLPAWPTARRLARLDRAESQLDDLEVADRYHHLAAGVRGALLAASRSLFAERDHAADDELLSAPPEVQAHVERAVEDLIQASQASSTRALVRAISAEQAARLDLRARLRVLERPGYRFGDFAADARRAKHVADAPEDVQLATIRELYRQLTREFAAAIRQRGRELQADGLSTIAALDQIRAEEDGHRRALRDRARALLA